MLLKRLRDKGRAAAKRNNDVAWRGIGMLAFVLVVVDYACYFDFWSLGPAECREENIVVDQCIRG
jgi:hypothetical protein